MKQIIRDGAIVEDSWGVRTASEYRAGNSAFKNQRSILSLADYLACREELSDCRGEVGALLEPDDDPEQLLSDIAELPVIAIRFPSFADGRGYSIGCLLRSRYCFAGELRAVGDILRDQLYFLQRCGFNAFELRGDQDIHLALAAFADYGWQPNTLIKSVAIS